MKGFRVGSIPYNFYTDYIELCLDTKPIIEESWDIICDDLILAKIEREIEYGPDE